MPRGGLIGEDGEAVIDIETFLYLHFILSSCCVVQRRKKIYAYADPRYRSPTDITTNLSTHYLSATSKGLFFLTMNTTL